MEDALYCRFNARGRKQFANLHITVEEFARKYPDVIKVTLPAHKAAVEGRSDCLRDIFVVWNESGVASRDTNGATPLHVAARTNRVEIVKWLLRYTELSPLTTAKRGETPVHVAVAQGHIECLKALLDIENKIAVFSAISVTTDNNGLTPLHVAIMMHRKECAIQLINELGFKSVNSINESGITCCHIAAAAGNLDVLKHIAQKHKKLLSQEAADGATPIHYAAQEGHLEAVTFLHSKGKCSLETRVDDGMKPIHAAAQSGHTSIVQYIVCQTGNSSIFDVTDDGGTPLHFAAIASKENTVRWLVRSDLSGTLIHQQDLSGNTPAHDAAEYGCTSVLKFLLDCGADLYAKNKKGHTPYLLATNGKSSETKAFILSYAPILKQKAISNRAAPPRESLESEAKLKQDASDAAKPAKKKKSKQDKTKGTEKDKEEKKTPLRKLSQHDDTAPLEIDEEDFRLFRNESNSALGTLPKPALPSMTSESSEIVVRYTESTEQADGSGTVTEDKSLPVDDSEFGEIGSRGAHRRSVRSILDAIHSHGHPPLPAATPLGFQPQFRSNPLVDDPRILAMAEQMQAQSVVQNSEHHMAEAESRLQGKGTTSSSTSLRDRPDPDPAENPQTPPSTPLAATSATEVLQAVEKGDTLPNLANHPQSLEVLMAVLQSTPQEGEEEVDKNEAQSPSDTVVATEQHLSTSSITALKETQGTDQAGPREGSMSQLQGTSAVKLEPTSASQSATHLQANTTPVADNNQSASKTLVLDQSNVQEPDIQLKTLEPTNAVQHDTQQSSAVTNASQSATNLNSSVVPETSSAALRVLDSSTTNVLILEPQREARFQVKPAVVHEPGNVFKVQLRKLSQDTVSQPKNEKPVSDIQTVQLRKINQESMAQPRNNEKAVNDIMAVQLRKVPQKQTITNSEASKEELNDAFSPRNRLKRVT